MVGVVRWHFCCGVISVCGSIENAVFRDTGCDLGIVRRMLMVEVRVARGEIVIGIGLAAYRPAL